MRLFRRRQTQPMRPAPPAPAHVQRHTDWRTYNDVADTYAKVVAPQFAPIAADVLSAAEQPSGARILDVGTGTGNVLAAARNAGVSAVGVDPSVAMLAQAKQADPGSLVAAADTINFPFRDAGFDAVTANFALAFFRKLDTALFEILRVLKQGGIFVASGWEIGEDELTRTWRLLVERAVGVELARDAGTEGSPWEEVAGDRARLEGVLRDAGFHPVQIQRKQYALRLSRDDYITLRTTGAMGRFVKSMLGDGWDRFIDEARAVYAQSFPEHLVDFRDVLIAIATKP
jgi:SAM-dependent methyltransferase